MHRKGSNNDEGPRLNIKRDSLSTIKPGCKPAFVKLPKKFQTEENIPQKPM
jgi:hypothetical protein